MFNYLSVALSVAVLSLLVGCSGSDTQDVIDDIFDKPSIALTGLDNHALSYRNNAGAAEHTDIYCAGGMLGSNSGSNGTWLVNGNDLAVMNSQSGVTDTYMTNGNLEKNKDYDTANGANFKVLKISETVCVP